LRAVHVKILSTDSSLESLRTYSQLPKFSEIDEDHFLLVVEPTQKKQHSRDVSRHDDNCTSVSCMTFIEVRDLVDLSISEDYCDEECQLNANYYSSYQGAYGFSRTFKDQFLGRLSLRTEMCQDNRKTRLITTTTKDTMSDLSLEDSKTPGGRPSAEKAGISEFELVSRHTATRKEKQTPGHLAAKVCPICVLF
jgi:hypothetical protein